MIKEYYKNQVKKKNLFDMQMIKEYFPFETVMRGMLEIYQRVLGLEFIKLEGGEVWHDDVSLHQVNDKATGENLGYFFMDLHPRDGKFENCGVFGTQNRILDKNGKRQKAVQIIACS